MDIINTTMMTTSTSSVPATTLSSSPHASTAAVTATTSVASAVAAATTSSNASLSNYTTVVATTVKNIVSSILPSVPTTTTSITTTTNASVHLYNETVETITHISQPENISRSATWNITRVSESLPKAATSATASLCTTTMSSTSTEDPFDEFGPPEGVEYIFVPLGVMIFVIVLSAVVIIISRKRKLERLRHRLMPLYNFDPGEEGEDDWETELLDEGFSSRQRRQGYQSMDSEENTELFSPAHMQTLG